MNQINPAYIREKYDAFGVTGLTPGKYATYCIDMLDEHRNRPEICAALSYGLWIFFKREEYSLAKELITPPCEGLIPIEINYKWGFIDKDANETVSPKYDCVHDFCFDSRSAVCLNERWGFIDETGAVTIALQYDDVNDFSGGIAGVKINGKWGIINKTGKMIIPPKYDYVSYLYFNNSMICVKLNGKYGFIDKKGVEVTSAIYDKVKYLSEDFVNVVLDGREGFIDIFGKFYPKNEITES
jgi:hypothetical protein